MQIASAGNATTEHDPGVVTLAHPGYPPGCPPGFQPGFQPGFHPGYPMAPGPSGMIQVPPVPALGGGWAGHAAPGMGHSAFSLPVQPGAHPYGALGGPVAQLPPPPLQQQPPRGPQLPVAPPGSPPHPPRAPQLPPSPLVEPRQQMQVPAFLQRPVQAPPPLQAVDARERQWGAPLAPTPVLPANAPWEGPAGGHSASNGAPRDGNGLPPYIFESSTGGSGVNDKTGEWGEGGGGSAAPRGFADAAALGAWPVPQQQESRTEAEGPGSKLEPREGLPREQAPQRGPGLWASIAAAPPPGSAAAQPQPLQSAGVSAPRPKGPAAYRPPNASGSSAPPEPPPTAAAAPGQWPSVADSIAPAPPAAAWGGWGDSAPHEAPAASSEPRQNTWAAAASGRQDRPGGRYGHGSGVAGPGPTAASPEEPSAEWSEPRPDCRSAALVAWAHACLHCSESPKCAGAVRPSTALVVPLAPGTHILPRIRLLRDEAEMQRVLALSMNETGPPRDRTTVAQVRLRCC